MLITGETGTGKELIARAVHHHSRRAARPFVPVNCGALAESLLESELFGHVRGSFTGAVGDKEGRVRAGGRRLHLPRRDRRDHGRACRCASCACSSRARCGRWASRVTTVNVRVVAATNRDLERAVREGAFRQDLYYRLNVIRIAVPPLRERREDIPLPGRARAARRWPPRAVLSAALAPEALGALMAYGWPGNVRELENVLEGLALGATGETLDVEDLPAVFRERPPASLEVPLFDGLPSLEQMEKRYLAHVLEVLKRQPHARGRGPRDRPAHPLPDDGAVRDGRRAGKVTPPLGQNAYAREARTTYPSRASRARPASLRRGLRDARMTGPAATLICQGRLGGASLSDGPTKRRALALRFLGLPESLEVLTQRLDPGMQRPPDRPRPPEAGDEIDGVAAGGEWPAPGAGCSRAPSA